MICPPVIVHFRDPSSRQSNAGDRSWSHPGRGRPTSHRMVMTSTVSRKKATASTGIDAHLRGPMSVENMRGSSMLRERRHRGASRRVVKNHNVSKTRIATLNVGTLTSRSCELAAALERRRINICAV
ncbi:hypothetical protein Y032_0009g431 [Ancylostoma ceylanicum]|uniref:Uncharacterized protein n=1 Tax=Ancylostoma ceylanicum TaxID=53326 RepID=A0A016VHN1_9BILA|nr:hypothetical protein Y032_0009g431 [Ancylostoma ceylanicum]